MRPSPGTWPNKSSPVRNNSEVNMLNDELKNLVNQIGAIVVVENSQPKFIVVSYERFRDLFIHKNVDKNENPSNDINEEIIERLNDEISALKAEVAEKEKELTE